MTFTVYVLMAGLMLSVGCHKHRLTVVPANITVHEDRGYGFQKLKNGSYLVFVRTERALPEVRHEIGCPCIEDQIGKIYQLTPPKREKD